MATRQYIGARYTTKIYVNSQDASSAEWEASTVYEPLTLVTYNYGSYLSRKTVPASVGNPAANPQYWAQTGYYNGQISNLQNQIDTINNNITDIIGDIDDIDKKFNNARYKHILIIGDSYERVTSFGSCVSQDLKHGATSFISTNVQKSNDGYIWVASRGGAGFTNTEDGMLTGNGFLNLLTEAANNMTADEKSAIDVILIAGGVNDSSVNIGDADINMLPDNMTAFKNYADSNFPKALVNIFMLGRVRQLDTWTGRNPMDVQYNIYRYSDLAGRRGWGYIANSEYVSFRSDNFIDTDNLHPKADQGWMIASYIVNGLNNGAVDVTWIENPIYTITPVSGITINTKISCNLVNGTRHIRFDTINFTAATPITMQLGVPVNIGTQDAFYAVRNIQIDVPAVIWDNTNNRFDLMNLVLYFYGYNVAVINKGTANAVNATIDVNSVIAQSVIEFSAPTLMT